MSESQLNFFVDSDGVQHAIGTRHDPHGTRVGMWYFSKGKRTPLSEDKLIHIRTLPKKGTSPKCMVWSYREFTDQFWVELAAFGLSMNRVFYGGSANEVRRKCLFWISKEWNIPVGEITRFVNEHPQHFRLTQLKQDQHHEKPIYPLHSSHYSGNERRNLSRNSVGSCSV